MRDAESPGDLLSADKQTSGTQNAREALASLNRPTLTFLSGVSANCQLLAFRWYSSSNFMLMSSMDNCRRSQNPARSWAVGRGLALGF